ncbi:MAG: flagellar filament capping protein FliD [Deltaproteobacteria bacterium]|nr:flagellar filament capping protein FliD [Deltaproteobacteria bacterium]
MTISVGGLISGLDTNSMIEQLLELQQRPIVMLQQQEAAYQVKLTAYGSLKGVLDSMKSAAQALDAASDLTGFSTSSGDAALFTSSADSSAATGTHNVTVKQLAREHMVKSAAFTGTEEILEFKVDANNKFIDFTENTGGGASAEIAATLTEGSYTVSELETHIKTQLEAASDGAPSANNIDYTVSYDNTTKKFTIQENGSSLTQLDLRWATGANNANSASSLLGFDAADDTGAVTYTSDNQVGEGTIHLEIGSTFTIDSTNNKLNFKEDELGANPLSAELTATIASGTYTISDLETEIKTRLEAESTASGYGITYTVSYDNSTQKFTIQGANLDELKVLWKTGANGADNTGTSAASILGYTDTADDESAVSYTAANTVGTVYDISISATDTIEDVADAINDADAGVQAAVIFDGTNYYLTLSAEDSGAANVINLTVTDIDGDNADTNGLSRLAYREGGTTRLTQTQDALDSLIHVDGVTDIARSTNTIDDVIEGVTITLTDVHAIPASESDTLTVSRNTSTAVSKINSFVSAYNNVLDFFETYQGYDEDTEIAGSLQGDSTTNQIRNNLRRLVSQDITGVNTFSRLSNLGIILNDEGRLEVNSTTLNDALDDNFDDVIQFFTQSTTGSEGFGVRMVDILDATLDSTDGTLAARTDGIQTSIDGIEDQVERIEMRNLAWEARTRAQFNVLELLLSDYQNTGNYLSQQILGMQNLNNFISSR